MTSNAVRAQGRDRSLLTPTPVDAGALSAAIHCAYRAALQLTGSEREASELVERAFARAELTGGLANADSRGAAVQLLSEVAQLFLRDEREPSDDALHSHGAVPRPIPASHEEEVAQRLAEVARKERVLAGLDERGLAALTCELPRGPRAVLALACAGEFSQEELAAILEWSPAAVRLQLRRARQLLSRMLGLAAGAAPTPPHWQPA